MTAHSPVCDHSDLGDEEAEQQASQDVAGPVIGQVHTRDHHERDSADGKPVRDASDAGQEGGPGDVAAGERTSERYVRERYELDSPRQLPWRQRLGRERLEGDLDGGNRDDQERHPGIALTAPQSGDSQPERDATSDLCLPQDPDSGCKEVEPWRGHGLDKVNDRAIELAQRTDRDERGECDEGSREQRDADQR